MIDIFGKKLTREKAYGLIIKDYVDGIIHAHLNEVLEDILMDGFKGLGEWSDNNLEEFVNEICIFNNPKLEL